MARCGWCQARGLGYKDDGMLENHTIPGIEQPACMGPDNGEINITAQIVTGDVWEVERQRRIAETHSQNREAASLERHQYFTDSAEGYDRARRNSVVAIAANREAAEQRILASGSSGTSLADDSGVA